MWKLRKFNFLNKHEREIGSIPTIEEGDLVKLIFEFEGPIDGVYAERMWVKVTEAGAHGFVGSLDNDPTHLTSLKSGQEVKFKKSNIFDIYSDE